MLDIAEELERWWSAGTPFAVATVVSVTGSAPRQPGAALAVNEAGTAVGSISGGCVEAAAYDLCRQVLESGSSVVEHFAYSEDDAFALGLTCGGTLDVLVQPVYPPGSPGCTSQALAVALAGAVSANRTLALVRVVQGPGDLLGRALVVRQDGSVGAGGLGDPTLDQTAAAAAAALLDTGRTEMITIGASGGRCGERVTLFVESAVPPPRMLVFGAIDFASAMVRMGSFLGYRVTVCDARPVFATKERFPDTEVVVEWPHRYLDRTEVDIRTVVCVLTHDPKFDIPLLIRALRLPVAFVGAMGSRRTHEERVVRLRQEGVSEEDLTRLHSPIGLDLGARTPEETALSIAAEIIAKRRGGSGLPLHQTHGPIHAHAPEPGHAQVGELLLGRSLSARAQGGGVC